MAEIEDEFAIVSRLNTSPQITVRRAHRKTDGLPVILKSPGSGSPSEDEIGRLEHEYALLSKLAEKVPTPGIIKPVAWRAHTIRPTLVLHDSGGTDLSQLFDKRVCEPDLVIELARQVIASLDLVHRAGVLHKDINPRNLVYNATTRFVEIIDFNVAVNLDHEFKSVVGQHGAEGSLAYAPPEQLGQLSRHADPRTDYYSLGATLYRLACGELPFTAGDGASLTHLILTAVPRWPSQVNPAIPESLAHVIMKLLAKAQEDRYQSAHGIDADLVQCQEVIRGRSKAIDVGSFDRSERFVLPQRLYGRSTELGALRSALNDAARGRRVLVLLGGPSGIGKSALVTELQTELAGANALFTDGKCDQLRRHVPFSALAQAVETLIRSFLFAPQPTVDAWRRRIQTALGSIGQAALEIIPALELLVGKQPAASVLPPQETENRLHLVLQRLIEAVAERTPLVLFLDDLQWADPGTIRFIHGITYGTHPVAGMLVVAAYRNDEVPPEHPLAQLMLTLRDENANHRIIDLHPLGVQATSDFVRDATLTDSARAYTLGALAHGKTGGNPFFLREYLYHLVRRGILTYDGEARCWIWDTEAVVNTSATDNVVNLLASTLSHLPREAQRIVCVAACLGNEFHLADLEQVVDADRLHVTAALEQALRLNLLIPMTLSYRYAEHTHGDVIYRFAHDRIQQAAADLMPEAEAPSTHLRIGTYLRTQWQTHANQVNMFNVLAHLNPARGLLTDDAARIELAQLNVLGAREAKRAGAFLIALTYLDTALSLLGERAWAQEPSLTRQIHLEMADNEFLRGSLQEASERLDNVAGRTPALLDRVEVEVRRVYALTAAGKMQEALRAGVDALRLMGIKIRRHPTRLDILTGAARVSWALARQELDRLAFLPPATDRRVHLIFDLLASINLPAFYTDHTLFALLAVVAPRLTIKYGTTRMSSYTIGIAALMFVQLNQYAAAKRLARVTRHSMAVHPDGSYHAAIEFAATCFIEFIDLPPQPLLAQYKRAYEVGLETGDPLFGAWSAVFCAATFLWVSVARCNRELGIYESFVMRRGDVNHAITLREIDGIARLVAGEQTFEAYMQDPVHREALIRGSTGAAHYVCLHVPVLWMWGRHEECWQAVLAGLGWEVFEVSAEQLVPAFCLYASLAYCVLLGGGKKFSLKERITFARMRFKLRAVSKAGADMYGGLTHLVEGAFAAVRGKHARAMSLFEAAIAGMARSEFSAFTATAHEVVGRYHAAQHRPLAARGYLQTACDMQRAWGAEAKLALLTSEFSDVLGTDMLASRNRLAAHTETPSRNPRAGQTSTGALGGDMNMDAWRRLSRALTEGVTRNELISIALATLREASAATRAIVVVFDMPKQRTVHDSHEGIAQPDQIIAFVQRTRELVRIEDVAEAPQLARDTYTQLARPKGLVCLPMVRKGEVRGVIYLENTLTAGVFTAARVSMLELIAPQIAAALDNSRAPTVTAPALPPPQPRPLPQRSEAESTEVNVANGFAHEMRNALSAVSYPMPLIAGTKEFPAVTNQSIYDVNEALLSGLRSAPPVAHDALVAALQENNNAMRDAIENMAIGLHRGMALTQQILDFARASHIVKSGDAINLSNLVRAVISEHRKSLDEHRVEINAVVPLGVRATISEPHAYAIVRNLIANARDAVVLQHDRPRQIEIAMVEENNQVAITVRDTGVGITPEHGSQIFRPFFTTKGNEGTGLGLGLSRRLAAAYGGTLSFESTPGVGTTFKVELPNGAGKSDKS